MQDIFIDIIKAMNLPPYGSGGGSIIREEMRTWFDTHPLTINQIIYLVDIASPTHQRNNGLPTLKATEKPRVYRDSMGAAYFIAHGLTDGIAAKRAGPIALMLDMDTTPKALETDIQELHTMMVDFVHNVPLIAGETPFLAHICQEMKKKDGLLDRLETAMAKAGIDQKEIRPKAGAEFFGRIDKDRWQELGRHNSVTSTATCRQRALESPSP